MLSELTTVTHNLKWLKDTHLIEIFANLDY